MLDTGILRKKVTANKEDMEKVINILMSIGYTHCSISDSNDFYSLSASILEEDDESNIRKRVYNMYLNSSWRREIGKECISFFIQEKIAIIMHIFTLMTLKEEN